MEEQKQSTEIQKRIKELPKETQWAIMKPLLNIATTSVSEKMKILPVLSAISVAMLIVATFDKKLVPLTDLQIRVILSLLLFLIPYSLSIYISEREEETNKALNILEKYFGKGFRDAPAPKTCLQEIKARSPKDITYLYWGIIIFLLWAMWQSYF